MSEALHLLLTYATIAAAVAWLVQHFVRKPSGCDGCDAPRLATIPRSPKTAIRRQALVVVQGNGVRPS